jgi:hypothetical protein
MFIKDKVTRELITILLLIAVIFGSHSCLDCEDELQLAYNAALVYRFANAGASDKNIIPQYIRSLDVYIFDREGKLVSRSRIDKAGEQFVSLLNLAPGGYRAVAWGNANGNNKVEIPSGEQTTIQQLQVMPSGAVLPSAGDKLFYGYRPFRVDNGRTNHVNVDMEYAYMDLAMSIEFREATMAASFRELDGVTVELAGVGRAMDFIPAYKYVAAVKSQAVFTAEQYELRMDHFAMIDESERKKEPMLGYIPGIDVETTATVAANVKVNGTLTAHFVTYRPGGTKPLTLTIKDESGNALAHTIDLRDFVRKTMDGADINTLRHPAMEIRCVINPDKSVTVSLGFQGWVEGTPIGWN